MKLFLHKKISKDMKKETLEKKKEMCIKMIQKNQVYSHGKSFINNKGERCIYSDNILLVYKTRESGVIEVTKIIDNRKYHKCASIPTTRKISDYEKNIVIHRKNKAHVKKRYIERNMNYSDVLKAVGRGIRSKDKDGAIFYFLDNTQVVTSETQDEIRITTIINISIFSENNLTKSLPLLRNEINEKLNIDCIVSLRDNHRFLRWENSNEARELDYHRRNIRNNIYSKEYLSLLTTKNFYGFSRMDILEKEYYDKGDNLQAYYYSYPNQEKSGHLPISALEHNIAVSSYDIVFTLNHDENVKDSFKKIFSFLETFGLKESLRFKNKEDFIFYKKDEINNHISMIIDASLFTRNDDQRFQPKTGLESILETA